MASAQVMSIPQNGVNIFAGGQMTPGTVVQPTGQMMPGTVVQPAGTVQYVQYVVQPVGSPTNQPQPSVPEPALQKILKVETKTLGAIQIMIGLIHIGFGAVSAVIVNRHYVSLATVGGYPFWGALFFIISGSLSVSAANNLTSTMVQCSIGLNITSAVMAVIGSILYVIEFVITPINNDPYNYWMNPVGVGISALLFLFTLLEFAITVSTAHFGCKATCCKNDTEIIAVPYVISNMDAAQGSTPLPPPPPSYESAFVSPKIE